MLKRPISQPSMVIILGAFLWVSDPTTFLNGPGLIHAQTKQPAVEYDIRWDTGKNVDQLLERVNRQVADGWQVTKFQYEAQLDRFTFHLEKATPVKPQKVKYDIHWDSRANVNQLLQRVNAKAADGWVVHKVVVGDNKFIFLMERNLEAKGSKTEYDFHWDTPVNIEPLRERVRKRVADGWHAESLQAPNLIVYLMTKRH